MVMKVGSKLIIKIKRLVKSLLRLNLFLQENHGVIILMNNMKLLLLLKMEVRALKVKLNR